LIDQLGLYNTVFADTSIDKKPLPSTNQWKYAYNCLSLLESESTTDSSDIGSIYNILVHSEDDRYVNVMFFSQALLTNENRYTAWLLAALAPWSFYPIDAANPLEYGIKLEGKLRKLILAAFTNYRHVSELKLDILNGAEIDRTTLGLAMRKLDGNWRLDTLLAILVQAMESQSSDSTAILTVSWLSELAAFALTTTKLDIDFALGVEDLSRLY
jgi:hypothetical protein